MLAGILASERKRHKAEWQVTRPPWRLSWWFFLREFVPFSRPFSVLLCWGKTFQHRWAAKGSRSRITVRRLPSTCSLLFILTSSYDCSWYCMKHRGLIGITNSLRHGPCKSFHTIGRFGRTRSISIFQWIRRSFSVVNCAAWASLSPRSSVKVGRKLWRLIYATLKLSTRSIMDTLDRGHIWTDRESFYL